MKRHLNSSGKPRRTAGAAAALFCAGALLVSIQGPVGATPSSVPVPAAELGAATAGELHETSLRAQFGLRSDLAYVRQIRSTSHMTELGIPLAASEAADITSRDRLGAVVARLDAASAGMPSYAGAWIDQGAGGVIHIGMVDGGTTTNVNALLSVVPPLTPVVVTPTDSSLATLTALQDKITDRLVVDAGFRATVVQSVLLPQANVVRLTLLVGTPQSVSAQVRSDLGEAGLLIDYAAAKFQPQSRDLANGLLYGGEWTGGCTVGYSNTTGTDGLRYMVTAGHCGSGNYYQGKENQGTYLGFGHNNHYAYGGFFTSKCDCVAVGSLHDDLATNQVLVFNNGKYTYTNTATPGNYASGQRLCVSGAAYADSNGGNILCGQMLGSGSVVYGDGPFVLTDAGITSAGGTLAGDSGGPYGNGGSFLGIHAANNILLRESAFSKSTNLGLTGVSLQY